MTLQNIIDNFIISSLALFATAGFIIILSRVLHIRGCTLAIAGAVFYTALIITLAFFTAPTK